MFLCSEALRRRGVVPFLPAETETIIPGDGVGPELITQAVKLFRKLEVLHPEVRFELVELTACGVSVELCGDPIPETVLKAAETCQAVLFGNIGGKKYQHLPIHQKSERALLEMRRRVRVCTNLRPVLPLLAEKR